MERNASFAARNVSSINIRLAWAQIEVFADDVDTIQVMAAGDPSTVADLRIEYKDGVLLVEQPQYGFTINIMESKWLQVCVRIPLDWKKELSCSTISSLLSARKLNTDLLTLDTVTGDLRALELTAREMALKTVSGDIRGENLRADKLNLRSISGDASLCGLCTGSLRCTSVSGAQDYQMTETFRKVEVNAVSGNVIITAPVDAMNVNLRSVSGRVLTEGVSITDREGCPTVNVTGVSADLKLMCINR